MIKIGCSCNSISAVIDEIMDTYLILQWSIGAFKAQTLNRVKNWIKEGAKSVYRRRSRMTEKKRYNLMLDEIELKAENTKLKAA